MTSIKSQEKIGENMSSPNRKIAEEIVKKYCTRMDDHDDDNCHKCAEITKDFRQALNQKDQEAREKVERVERRLNAVRYLVESDTGMDADCVAGGMDKGATEKEKEFGALITRIYTLVHPGGGCTNPHENWEKENKELEVVAANEMREGEE